VSLSRWQVVMSLISEAGDFEAGNKGRENGCQNDQKKWGKIVVWVVSSHIPCTTLDISPAPWCVPRTIVPHLLA
jgi:hypothetical protein